jgi:hypothetical protein
MPAATKVLTGTGHLGRSRFRSLARSKKHRSVWGLVGLIALSVLLFGTAAEDCRKYASHHRLPKSFQEVASGELSGFPHSELFVLSDGICTCANVSSDSRSKGGAHPNRAIWSCRRATDDERSSKPNLSIICVAKNPLQGRRVCQG